MADPIRLRPARPARTGDLLGEPVLYGHASVLPLPLSRPARARPGGRFGEAAAAGRLVGLAMCLRRALRLPREVQSSGRLDVWRAGSAPLSGQALDAGGDR